MKPQFIKNLSLPWTPQGEKASGNHQILLPREKAASLISPNVKLTQSHFLVFLYSINYLTSLTMLLWPIHHHSQIPLQAFIYMWAKANNQKTTYLRKKNM